MEESDLPPLKKQKTDDISDDFTQDFAEDVKVTDFPEAQDKKYQDSATAEEIEKLKEFHVLDEVKSNDEESEDDESEDEKSDGIPDEEIDRMLDDNLPEEQRVPKPKEKPYITRQKIVLEEKGINHFEVLPLDWLVVRHYSGMPVYMHRPTRVCTLAKPYFIGKENTRRHDIPISAIPCLNYRRALEEEEKQTEIDRRIAEQIKHGTWKNSDHNKTSDSTNDQPSENSNLDNTNEITPGKVTSTVNLNAQEVMEAEVSSSDSADPVDSTQDSNRYGKTAEVLHKTESDDNVFKCPYPVDRLDVRKNHRNKEADHSEVNHNTSNNKQMCGQQDEVSPYVVIQLVPQNKDSKEAKVSQNIDEITDPSDTSKTLNDDSKNGQPEFKCPYPVDTNTDTEMRPSFNEAKSEETVDQSEVLQNQSSQQQTDENEVSDTNVSITAATAENMETDVSPEEIVETTSEVKNNQENDVNAVGSSIQLGASSNQETSSSPAEAGYQRHYTSYSRKIQQTEAEKELEISQLAKPLVLPGGVAMPPPRVETVTSSWKTQLLAADQVTEYCQRLFKFKTISIMHFKRWADRREYAMARKSLQYPALPQGTKLITIPAAQDGRGGGARRDWVMNMNGRSYLSVFHEYVRRALQKQPVYEFKQLENASSPYQATVYIGGMAYGVGAGSSKRLAKAAAARASIHVLIPDAAQADQEHGADPDFSFFDYVGIEDPRIAELCAAACEPAPHAILRTCLLRNCGAGDRHIHTELKKLEYQKVELTMRVGKHSATVVCKNKKTAKQRAAQAILQALHPHISSWGSLLRLYGSRSVQSCKEKKQEEQEITLLQDKAKHNEPNYAVLEKLKLEMRRLRDRDEAVVPIGTFLVTDDLPTHSGSNLNNVEL